MLTHTFLCFKGLTAASERTLWHRGCLSWAHFRLLGGALLSPRKGQSVRRQIDSAEIARRAPLPDYFLTRLPSGHRLRIFPEFLRGAAFLDIETTGLGGASRVTVIGVWFRGRYRAYIRGRDLGEFLLVWPRILTLLTFNGKRFDVPFLMREFGLAAAPAQIDLMDEARAHGLKGGLKDIERALGLRRGPDALGDGRRAVLLWGLYERTGCRAFLEALVAYNRQDVMSLLPLANEIWKRSAEGSPFRLPAPFRGQGPALKESTPIP